MAAVIRQASWKEPLLLELEGSAPCSYRLDLDGTLREARERALKKLGERHLRRELNLPQVSELEVLRHFSRLSQMNYSVSTAMYPLGSCTMKYSPLCDEEAVRTHKLMDLHPLQDESTIQGALELLYRLERMLCAITGMDRFSYAASAGAHGEFAGCLIMRRYHLDRGERRGVVIVPDSAHGTNPASASMAGLDVEVVETGEDGNIDIARLREAMGEDVAGLMLTNPNTLGLFESGIRSVVDLVHSYGGLLYYDGANLNAIGGIARPGDMGFDILHLNLHKTFSTPHGGGGPGAGPIGVKRQLERYLPPPLVSYSPDRGYYLEVDRPGSIGRIRAHHGNFLVCVKAYAYLLRIGWEGLRESAIAAVAASNYLLSRVREMRGVSLPYGKDRHRKHEFVISLSRLKRETGVSAMDVAKRLLDYGFHAPTVYFPLIVNEALMIEPTETEPKRELDRFIEALRGVIEEAYRDPALVKTAPHSTAVGRVNEAKANHPRWLTTSWRVYQRRASLALQEERGASA